MNTATQSPTQQKTKPLNTPELDFLPYNTSTGRLPRIKFQDLFVRVPQIQLRRDTVYAIGHIPMRVSGTLNLHPDHEYFEKKSPYNSNSSHPDVDELYAEVPVLTDQGEPVWCYLTDDHINEDAAIAQAVLEACCAAAPAGWLDDQREAWERSLS